MAGSGVDENPDVRSTAAAALKGLGPQAAAAVPALLAALRDPDTVVRLYSARALLQIEPEAASRAGVLSLILKALTDKRDWPRTVATMALAEIPNQETVVVPALTERLQKDSFSSVRHAAVCGLRDLGGSARTAVPALLAALGDSSGLVQYEAARALKKIDPEAAAKAGVE